MARPSKHDGVLYQRKESAIWWMRYRDSRGQRQLESTGCTDWQEANKKMRERLAARDNNILDVVRKGEHMLFKDWAEFFLENYSKPPIREPKTHEANQTAMKHLLNAFSAKPLASLNADEIELFLRSRLRQRVRRKTGDGFREFGLLKPATVHQEFRVLRRMLNVAVRKRLLPANPCWGVEFPVRVKGMFRPHYMSWSEQLKIELQAPPYLTNAVRIITETGLRVYKELTPMRQDQVDLVNAMVWIPESKTAEWNRRGAAHRHGAPGFQGPDKSWRALGRGFFPAARTQAPTRGRLRRCGRQRSASGRYRIFGFTICVRRMPPGFLLVESQMNGSRSCSGRAMRRSSRSTRR